MKIQLHPQHHRRGVGTLLFMAMIAMITGAGLVYFLRNSQQENIIVDRSESWNVGMVLAEAGIEEGMTLINNGGWPNNSTYSSDGWALNGSVFSITRTLSPETGSYTVYVTNSSSGPSILSIGSAYATDTKMNSNVIKRAVLIKTTISVPFPGALTLKSTVDFNGKNVTVDSYDSRDPFHSYWPNYPNGRGYGLYTNTDSTANSVRNANGNVATDGAATGIIDIGNGRIYGRVDTGPGGSTTYNHGSVGDIAFVNAGTQGIKSGYSRDDMNTTYPDVTLPATNWVSLANNTSITNPGAYKMGSIDANMTISASNVVLYVTNGISLSGNPTLTLSSNASVTMYVGGPSMDIGGNGGINNVAQHATQLIIWGLPSLTSISIHGNGQFFGAIYAPEAAVSLKGSGNSGGFNGALTANSIVMTGNSTFSYDEALRIIGSGSYIVTSWFEVANYN